MLSSVFRRVTRLVPSAKVSLSRPSVTAPCLFIHSSILPSFSTFAARIVLFNSIRGYADHVMVKVPQMADSISEGTLKTWHKKVGDFVRADEEVATIETDKIDVAVNSPTSGVIVEQYSKEEDTVVVAAELFKLEKRDASQVPEPTLSSESTSSTPEPQSAPTWTSPVSSTPTLTPVPTPSPHTQTSQVIPPASKPSQSSTSKPSSPVSESFSKSSSERIEERVKISRMRQRIADRLKESQNTSASLTTFNEIDMSNLIEFRKKYKDQILKEHGIKFGFMSAFAKAVTYGVKHVPVINARIGGNEVVYPNFVDISVAVATPKGLVTPVVRNVQSMSLLDIERSLAELASKARDNKITIEDMAGGTFTISNGGVFGSMFGTPIINVPQSAILGMHAVKERAVVIDGKIDIRPIMYICLTYDHRLIDGREAVTFLVKVKEAIEDPRCVLF